MTKKILILNSIDNILYLIVLLLMILDRLPYNMSYNLLILPIITIFLTSKTKLGRVIKNLQTPN
jgi:hypothetical protein